MKSLFGLIVFLAHVDLFSAEEFILPKDIRVIKVKYDLTTITISNKSQFIAIKLKSNAQNGQCNYTVKYGDLSYIMNDSESVASIIDEASGIFSENEQNLKNTIVWPGINAKSGIVKDVFVKWSMGNREFGYLYYPEGSKVSIGFEFP